MTEGLFYIVEHAPHVLIMDHLLHIWNKKLHDINFCVTLQTKPDLIKYSFFNSIIYRLSRYLFNIHARNRDYKCPSLCLQHMYNNLKSGVNVNIRYPDTADSAYACLTPIMAVIEIYINKTDSTRPLFTTFLEGFLKEFQDSIDFLTTNKEGETVFQICNIKEKDDSLVVERKEYVLSLLKKYCPQKLSFTKKGLEKTHNCSFIFSAKRMYDEI